MPERKCPSHCLRFANWARCPALSSLLTRAIDRSSPLPGTVFDIISESAADREREGPGSLGPRPREPVKKGLRAAAPASLSSSLFKGAAIPGRVSQARPGAPEAQNRHSTKPVVLSESSSLREGPLPYAARAVAERRSAAKARSRAASVASDRDPSAFKSRYPHAAMEKPD